MDGINLRQRTLEMSVLMTPDKSNFSGKVHGGEILKLLDQVAYTCASRYCGHYVVTLSVDQVFFKKAIRVGDLVTFLATVNCTGTTSMEVGIKVIAEDLKHQAVSHTNTCYFTMVAVDDEGMPTKVPPISIDNETDQRRFDQAQKRKKMRLEFNKPK